MANSTNSDNKAGASVSGATASSDDGNASSPPGPNPYPIGEIVLANHKGCFYEAKVEKIELRGNEWMFYIHYRGWKRHWDEWMGVDRMMKCTEENLQKRSTLDKKDGTEKSVRAGRISQNRTEKLVGGGSKKQVSDTSDTNQKKKRKLVKVKDSAPMEKSTSIFIPPALRKQLIDDFEFVKAGKLVKLPRSPNVDEILIKYRDYRKQKDGVSVISESVEEILSGLHGYFDKALPVLLLYNKERQQYEQAMADNVSPSKIYGAEHLLRLFVKLPALLYNLNIEEDTLIQLQQKLQELLRFLRKNHHHFFLSSYHLPEQSETVPKKDGAT